MSKAICPLPPFRYLVALFCQITVASILLLMAPTWAAGQDSLDAADSDSADVDVEIAETDQWSFIGIKYDSTDVEVRALDPSAWTSYKGDSRFEYYFKEAESNPIEAFFLWLAERFGFMEDVFVAIGDSYEVILYILLAIALGLIVRASRKDGLSGIFRRDAVTNLGFEERFEDIQSLNFLKLIGDAVNQGDFRRAVRLEYLKLLGILTDANLIDWRPEKTNAEYLREVSSEPIAPSMRQLTLLFDYTWYGGFSVTSKDYIDYREMFETAASTVDMQGRKAE